ncbi:11634_t:CDS:2, partial [Scutellospora calospora]
QNIPTMNVTVVSDKTDECKNFDKNFHNIIEVKGNSCKLNTGMIVFSCLFAINIQDFISGEISLSLNNNACLQTDIDFAIFLGPMETYYENFKPQSKPKSSKGHGSMDIEASNVVDEVLRFENDNN